MSVVTEASAIPISVATLISSKDIGVDLYLRSNDAGDLKLYRDASFPLRPQDLERLRNRGIKQLYILSQSREKYQSYLRSIASPDGDGPSVDLGARVAAVNEVVRDVLEADFKSNDDQTIIASATELGAMTADVISHDEFAAADMLRVLHHDYATFTHSANVSFYASMLAKELGLSSQDIQAIAAGGLLHDLGKLEIDERILCKPGKLDDREFRIIRAHPVTGFRRLAFREDLDFGQLMMVYQHHERIDGRGYPAGVPGDEIHLWAKICAVVDVYEALTSHRPYRSPLPRRRVLEIQARDCGTAFDAEIFSCWESIILKTCS